MADRRTFGEKVKDTVETVKDKLTGHTHDKECRERDCRDGRQFTGNTYGGPCGITVRGEMDPREPGVITTDIRQPGVREELTRESGVLGTEVREPGAFGGQLGETGVIGGPYGETDIRREGRLYEAGERRNEL